MVRSGIGESSIAGVFAVVKVYEVPWDGAVEGLGDARSMPLPGGDLGDGLGRALAAAGGQRVNVPEHCLVIPGGVALGPTALAAAFSLGQSRGRDCQIRLGGRLGELLDALALGGAPLRAAWIADGTAEDLDERVRAAPVVDLDPAERRVPIEVLGTRVELPLSDRVILPIRHWVQLLWGDLLLLGPHLWRALLSDIPIFAGLKIAFAAVRSCSVQPERLAAALCVRGAGARVHPSAVVEASVLGEGAQVGAGAVVRGAVLGAGARVEELALCEGAVLGAGAVVQRQAMLKYGVLGPGAMIGGVTQLSVFGPHASLKRGAYGMDQSLGGTVRVRVGERMAEAPLGLVGVCLGPGSLVGSGVRIAPGRVVPQELALVAPGALTRPEAIEGPVAVLGPGRGCEP